MFGLFLDSFKTFFGLRDFIHLIHYLRRKGTSAIDAQLIIRGLERNFNGNEDFELTCNTFIAQVSLRQLKQILTDLFFNNFLFTVKEERYKKHREKKHYQNPKGQFSR